MARPPTENPPKTEKLLDTAGRPVVGYVERNTSVADRWLGREIRFYRPVHFRKSWPGSTKKSLHKRAQIRFMGSHTWYEARRVYAPPAPGLALVPLLKALRTYSTVHWWMSPGTVLERPATLYEERHPDPPPRQEWSLVTAATITELVGYARQTMWTLPRSKERDSLEAIQKHKRRIARAKATLARHEEKLAVCQKRVDKWKAKVEKLENEDEIPVAKEMKILAKKSDG